MSENQNSNGEKKVHKLIAEYNAKIAICDSEIAAIEEHIRQARNEAREKGQYFSSSEQVLELDLERSELDIKKAQRQAYIQARTDFESLL